MANFRTANIRHFTKATLLGLCAILLGANIAIAQSENWSFADHPHPVFDELSTSEKQALKEANRDIQNVDECERIGEAEYGFYLHRYPEFSRFQDADEKFQKWKYYVAQTGVSELDACLSSGAWPDFMDFYITVPISDFYFCGLYSRPPTSEIEHQIATSIDALMVYAQTGGFSSVFDLLIANGMKGLMDLNPDVEYFIRQNARYDFHSEDWNRASSRLIPLLSDERRTFLDRAVARHDLQAVLATTDPCPPHRGYSDR